MQIPRDSIRFAHRTLCSPLRLLPSLVASPHLEVTRVDGAAEGQGGDDLEHGDLSEKERPKVHENPDINKHETAMSEANSEKS